MTGRLALAACLVITGACYAAAVLTPARLLAATEIPLLALLAAVTAAAWQWHRAGARRARTRNHPDHERHSREH